MSLRRKTDDDRQPDEAAGSGQRAAGSGGLQTRIWVKSKAFKREEGRGLLFPRGQEQLGKRLGREGRCLLEKRDTFVCGRWEDAAGFVSQEDTDGQWVRGDSLISSTWKGLEGLSLEPPPSRPPPPPRLRRPGGDQ